VGEVRGTGIVSRAVTAAHIVLGVLALALNVAAGLWGSWCWWRRRPSQLFWRLLRTAQAMVVIEAAWGCILLAIGDKVSSLHLLYGALPIAISFIAEQLRISAAQLILDKRGFGSTQEVGKLPAAEQQEIVLTVVRREIGVMALSALVATALIARAAMVH
jgi:hypothetical protein